MTSTTRTRTPDLSPAGEDRKQFPAGVALVGSQMRSTNLERDVVDELHSPYVGARAVDVLERIASAVADLRRPRAWSFVGPYGSGKSTLANLIDALLGHDAARRAEADRILAAASPALSQRIAALRTEHEDKGFLGAAVTARREPLVVTLSRALRTAVHRRWGKRVPKAIGDALAQCGEPDTSTDAIMAAVAVLCDRAPLLLMVDEFGKTLEYLASYHEFGSAKNDLFLLQELAEKASGPNGLPVFLMTLQHRSFLDYAAHTGELSAHEWAKIQGRFEDVTFLPHHGDSLQLLRRRLDHSEVNASGQSLIHKSSEASSRVWNDHGLNVLTKLDTDDFAGLYPLHPLTAIAAPILAAQIGQHDRSLSGFLNSGEPHTVRNTLASHSTPEANHASTVRLPQLYDYFLNSGRTTLLASSNASRWIEVDARINEANALPDADQEVLKTIGVLNLIDSEGALSATSKMVHFAMHDPTEVENQERYADLEEQLERLVRRKFLVFRNFSGEYRVWRGTNVDIDARLKEIEVRLDDSAIVSRLGNYVPSAVVAGRHSQVTGMMRVFVTAVSGPDTRAVKGPDEMTDPADGLLLFHLGTNNKRPTVDSALPVIVGTTENPQAVLNAGSHLIALKELQQDNELDHVALREVSDRIVQAENELRETLQSAFYPPTQQATWSLWPAGLPTKGSPARAEFPARSLSGLVTQACDAIFPDTPHIRNEMLGRHSLTSQAARARSDLLDAMLTASGQRFLGFPADKYGPERAMYSGALAYLGLHRENGAVQAEQTTESLFPYGFSRPGDGHEHAQPAWNALEDALTAASDRTSVDKIVRVLMSPPFGVKAGTVPLFLVAALLIRSQDVALFEEGTYLPRLTPDIVERLEKVPARFEVKHTPVGTGQRAAVVKKLMVSLKVEPPRSQALRNPNLLSVTRALMERIMVLSKYARRTKRISTDATALRTALVNAQDPDDLLFHSLPRALGFDPFLPSAKTNAASANGFAESVSSAADELSSIDIKLREEVVATLAREFRLPATLADLRSALASRLRGFAKVGLSAELKGFVDFAVSENLSDDDWLDPIIVRLTNNALGDWDDRDAAAFPSRAREMASALDRVSHLYQQENNTDEEGTLQTQLLTLTNRTGGEHRTLIYVPEQVRSEAETLATQALQQAEKTLGPDGARILLAALAQRVTEPAATPETERMGKA